MIPQHTSPSNVVRVNCAAQRDPSVRSGNGQIYALIVPKKLKDFQALLDNDMSVMNKTIALGLMSADELTSDAAGWQTWYTAMGRNAFVWVSEYL